MEAANIILMGSNVIFNGDEGLQKGLTLGGRNILAKFPPTQGQVAAKLGGSWCSRIKEPKFG